MRKKEMEDVSKWQGEGRMGRACMKADKGRTRGRSLAGEV
jgi:hypothetical protein